MLFRCAPNYHRRDIFNVNETIEILRAGQTGKKDEVIVNLFDFASDLLATLHA